MRLPYRATLPYPSPMDDEPNAKPGIAGWLHERLHIIIGVVGLIAWFIMLYYMFGDVL